MNFFHTRIQTLTGFCSHWVGFSYSNKYVLLLLNFNTCTNKKLCYSHSKTQGLGSAGPINLVIKTPDWVLSRAPGPCHSDNFIKLSLQLRLWNARLPQFQLSRTMWPVMCVCEEKGECQENGPAWMKRWWHLVLVSSCAHTSTVSCSHSFGIPESRSPLQYIHTCMPAAPLE